ncbi:STAS domain-containing protein [Pseudomonas sp. CFBP 13727]|uniref:STAS domain-containing protein n=1 Tax=Pseudomonas sp. CFBP 13727 TaxID=2775295 RepID=UPI00177ABBC1|nr:STAS domain-containing protein [Pseudomonas sp. CFBP 13727]MBD8623245.1 STAS domain-containing protein [Pseudomonas sp. CFBP 13727]
MAVTQSSVTQTFDLESNTSSVAISGRFDFSLHQQFREAYEDERAGKPSRYVIDLKNTTYMDSSALGMLLLLRDHAGGDNADIALMNISPDVRKILAISNFDKLFKIS